MITQRNELLEIIEKNGWKVICLDNYEFKDWATETWLLESVWTPIGETAYVSFLIDPMLGYENPSAWAIEIRKDKLKQEKTSENFVISLNQWHNKKDEFLQFLAQIR
ncbi:MAG: hypothetical protein MUC29_03135 [Pyrinomonadaceae bacterium]|jgi:hypothetical protein|nr:hypothetical protein [Pyrinomonadaceae bacterium]